MVISNETFEHFRKQEKKNCSKLFSDLVDCFVAEHYLTYVKSQHKK